MANPIVDLPEPLSPTSPTVSPSRTLIDHAIDGADFGDFPAQQAAADGEMNLQILRDDQVGGAGLDRLRRAAGFGIDQHPRVWMFRRGKHCRDLAGFDHRAVAHHQHAVGIAAHDREIMGDQQHREPPCLTLGFQQLQNLRLNGDIQRCGRFVGDQQGRIIGERHRDHHALSLTAGQFVRKRGQPVGGVGKSALLQQRDDTGAQCTTAQPLMQGNRPRRFAARCDATGSGWSSAPEKSSRRRPPRSVRNAALEAPTVCWPLSTTEPVGLVAPGGKSCRIDKAVNDLPDPLSPTMANVSPRSTLNDTPSTTHFVPKFTDRLATCSSAISPASCATPGIKRVAHRFTDENQQGQNPAEHEKRGKPKPRRLQIILPLADELAQRG